MRKTLNSIFALALMATFAVMPIQAVAEGEENVPEVISENPDSNSVDTWQELTDALQTDGTVVLSCDLTAGETDEILVVPETATVVLDLNGWTIDRNAGEDGDSGILKNYGNLTIEDSSEAQTGKMTGGCSNSPEMAGGITNFENAVLTLNGGEITGNKVIGERAPKKFGGGVYNAGGTFTMNGGKITNNISCANGGGIRNEGVFTLTGGEISGNIASDQIKGGGVASKGTMYICGNPKVYGNELIMNVNEDGSVDTDPSNLYIYPMTDRLRLVGPLTNDVKIGIDMGHPRSIQYLVFDFKKYMGEDADPNDYFTPDSYLRGLDKTPDGDVRLYCYADAYAILYEAVVGASGSEEARIDLLNDCILQDLEAFHAKFPGKAPEMDTKPGSNIELNLNGYTIGRNALESVKGGVFLNHGTLKIFDTSEGKTGTITGGYSETEDMAGGITNYEDGTLILENAKITGNFGGGILNNGSMTITGGEITNNTGSEGKPGGGITSSGTFYLSGNPLISGNKTADLSSNIYLFNTETSGKITIQDTLDFSEPVGITLNSNASFTEGFSEKMGDADFNAYFVADNGNLTLEKNSDGELYFTEETSEQETESASETEEPETESVPETQETESEPEVEPIAESDFASKDEFCEMAVKDFKATKGVTPANAEIIETTKDSYVIQLTDEKGNVLDVYTLDRKTGNGTNQKNEKVSLPQTGNNTVNPFGVGAFVLVTAGLVLMYQSGVFRKKEN